MVDLERPSERLVVQRLRNRAMEALELLRDGDAGVRAVGVVEYAEQFFDVINDDAPWQWRNWSCFNPGEVDALDKVRRRLEEACAATPDLVSEDDFIRSGLSRAIQSLAREALDLMGKRGRFREDVEESEPSLPG
jgi:hypothetical protein